MFQIIVDFVEYGLCARLYSSTNSGTYDPARQH